MTITTKSVQQMELYNSGQFYENVLVAALITDANANNILDSADFWFAVTYSYGGYITVGSYSVPVFLYGPDKVVVPTNQDEITALGTPLPNFSSYTFTSGGTIPNFFYSNPIDLVAASDSGSSNTDNITNVITPTIQVPISGAVTGEMIELKLDGNSLETSLTKVLDTTDISNGYVEFTVMSDNLGADGDKVFTADLTYNSSTTPLSGSLTVTLDTIAPTATATAASIQNTTNAVVQSTETGMAYLVKDSVTVTDLASITGAADSEFNSVEIASADTDTNLAATDLIDGTYTLYTVDVAGNLSAVATDAIIVDTTPPTDIALSNSNVDVAGGSDAIVGALSSTDVISTTFTYSLVSGDGSTDNGLFNINNGNLRVTGASTLTGGQTYSVRVQTTDAAGNTFEEALSISAVEAMVVTTNLDTGADATIDSDYATDLTDGGGLSLREALHYVNDGGVIQFDLSSTNNTITLADVANVKAGVTFDADAVGTLTIAGSTLNLIGALNITNGTNDNLTISSVLAGADGNMVKNGVGTLTLSGTNTYEGTTVVSQGTLSISSDANLGADYVQIGTTGATVNEETRSVLKITGTGEQDFDNVIVIGASEGEVWVDEDLIVTLNGKLDENPDDSGRDLVKTGLGTLILASTENEGTWNNEYGFYIGGLSGDIYVNEGEVQVASDECLPRGEIYLPDGKDLEFTGEGDTEVNNPINLRGDNASIDAGSKTVTISGGIKGASTFNVKGNVANGEPVGALVLSGDNNNFTGATNVSTGKLVVNGSMANTANVTVGGTLGGSGTIGTEGSKGAVTVSSTGTLAPGNSPGQMTLNNGLTLSAGAKLSIQLKTGTIDTNATPKVYGYDQVVVKGAVNITGSNLVLGLENGYSFNDGTVFKIIDNDSSIDAVVGTFAGLSNGSTVTANGRYFTINYAGGDGNDVTLTSFTPAPVPEPTPTPAPTPTPIPSPTPAPIFEKPVSKNVESQVPSASGVKGDGNGDGISDVDQRNVISLPTQKDLRETVDTPKVYLSIELPTGQTLTKAEIKSVPVTENEKITFKTETIDKKGNTVVVDTPITQETAPFGLFEFNFAGVKSTFDSTTGAVKGGTTDVKLYLDDKQTVEKYLKQTVSGTWEAIPFTYVYDEKLGKTVVAFSLTDGDKFDLDGKIDGGISDPGTPIITPKLTVAPVPAPVVELSSPTEKVFVGYGSEFELASGAAQVFGSSLREVLTLKAGASNVIVDQNVEQVNLAGKFADFTFEQQGNSLKVINNSITVAKITVQDDSNGTLLGFTDGLRSASFTNAKISVADKIVAADDVPLAILQKAGIYLAGVATNPLTVGSNSVSVYGSQASDKVGLSAFATTATIDANVEQVNFAGKFADYSFIPVGNSLNVLSGTTKIANIVIQDDSNGTTLNFTDQSYSAHFVTSATALQIEITGISAIV